MSRARTRRPGTRGATQGGGRRAVTGLPEDLPNAAVAALDDLITRTDDPDDVIDDARVTLRRAPAGPPPPPGNARRSSNIDRTAPPFGGADVRAQVPTVDRTAPAVGGADVRAQVPAVDDDQLVEETVLPRVPTLRFAVHEDSASLASAQGAIVAAGHIVSTGASGASGVERVVDAIRRGDIDAVIVALPGGEDVIDAALALEPRRPVIVAALAGDATSAIERAVAAGADLATVRPHDVGRLAPVLLAAARLHAERGASVSARGSERVLRARLDEIADLEPGGLQPFELFQRALEVEIKRARRYEYALSVALFALDIPPPPPPAGIHGILRARAGNALIHTIRDIDLATQLDHERFLVLLPYTDLTGAAGLGRRVIAAVAAGDPVVSGGRSFSPRVVGAVSGARKGEPPSFAKLMKDATRALDQARRDGAELAVQP